MSFSASFARGGTSLGYSEKYFSIDDILASQERIPGKVAVEIEGLGYLDPGSETHHLVAGTKMELPYWLVQAITTRAPGRESLVLAERPKAYKEGYREIMQADAQVVDLHKLGPYFYLYGCLLLKLPTESTDPERPHTDSYDIAKTMLQAFQTRFRRIMDNSQNAYNEDVVKLTSRLDERERHIFTSGQKGLADFQAWQERRLVKIGTSGVVQGQRKRKRAAMDTE